MEVGALPVAGTLFALQVWSAYKYGTIPAVLDVVQVVCDGLQPF